MVRASPPFSRGPNQVDRSGLDRWPLDLDEDEAAGTRWRGGGSRLEKHTPIRLDLASGKNGLALEVGTRPNMPILAHLAVHIAVCDA